MIKPATPRYNAQAFPIQPDRIIVGYDVSEGSGTTLTNRGRAAFSPIAGTDGTITTEVWDSDAEGPSLSFAAITVKSNASGADYIFPNLTVSCKCSPILNSLAGVIYNLKSGGGNGDLRLRKLADNTVRLQFNDNGTVRYYAWTPSAGEHHFIARVTPTGFYAWMDGVLGTPTLDPSTSTNPVRVGNGTSWELINGITALRVYTAWDVALSDYEIGHLWTDPYLPYREAPSSYFADWVGTYAARVTSTTARFQHVASLSLAGTARYRVKTAATIAGVDGATPSAAVTTTTPGAALTIDVTVTANTLMYFQEEWSPDGTNWYPFPGGIGSFNNQNEAIHVFGDGHPMQDAGAGPLPATPITGLDCIFDRTTGAYLATPGVRQYRFLSTYRYSTKLGIPHTKVSLGDEEYVDSVPLVADTAYHDDNDADVFDYFARLKNHIRAYIKDSAFEKDAGNHDGRGLQHQSLITGISHSRSLQKQATVAMKLFFPMPIDTTYTLGGERNSDADWKVPLGTPILGTSDGLNGVANQAWRDYAIDDADGLNATPLENYWGRYYGNAAIFHLDAYRYAGSIQGPATFGSFSDWRLGSTQKNWLRAGLKAARAAGKRWIILFIHTVPGGDYTEDHPPDPGPYGRGSGRHIGDRTRGEGYYAGLTPPIMEPTDQQWLYTQCLEFGIAFIIKGHDHRHSSVLLENGTRIITVASSNAAPSWIDEAMDNSYGTPQSLGTLDHTGAAIGGGVEFMYNCGGLLTITPSATSCVLNYYQTTFNTDGSDAHGDMCNPDLAAMQFVALATSTITGGSITVAGDWDRVGGVYLNSGLPSDDTWATLPQNLMTAGRMARANSTAYSLGDIRIPAAGANHLMFECTTAGTSAGSEPAGLLTAVNGGTVTDGTVVWTARPLTQLLSGAALPTSFENVNASGAIPCVGADTTVVKALVVPRLLRTDTISDPPTPIPQPVLGGIGSIGGTSGIGGSNNGVVGASIGTGIIGGA